MSEITVTQQPNNQVNITVPSPSSVTVVEKGQKGDAATITVGTVTTVAEGGPATVVNSGTTKDAVFDFSIPTGATGPAGADGQEVPAGGVADQIIVKQSATDYDTAWDYIQTITEAVKNVSGGPLDKGTPVHVTGSTGNTVEVIAADAATNYPAHLILNEDLADEAEGRGVALGFINNVNVPDASIYTEGQTVYLGASGGWTTTKPTGTNAIQNLGVIVKVNTSGNKISGVVLGAGRANDVPNLPSGKFFIGSATYTSESAYTLPTTDGTANQVLATDGSGAVTFVTPSTSNVTEGTNLYYTDARVAANSAVAANTAKISYPTADSTKVGFISVTQAVDLDTMESDIATNNAKVGYTDAAVDSRIAAASIDDLSDVDTSTVAPTDGQALVWDNANSKWEPGTVSGGGGGGIGTADQTLDADRTIDTNGFNLDIELDPTGTADTFTIHDGTHDLFQVDTSTTGVLFSVNDVSGLPKLEVDEDEGVIAKSIKVDDNALTAAGQYGKGAEIWYQGTSTPTAGSVYYLDSSGNWANTDASAVATAKGMLSVSAGADSDVDGMVIKGFVYVGTDPGGNVGDVVYLSETANQLTTTAPTTATAVVRVCGYKVGTNIVYFDPSKDWIEL